MVGRRGNGEGSIRRRKDGRWEGRYTIHAAEGLKRPVEVPQTGAIYCRHDASVKGSEADLRIA